MYARTGLGRLPEQMRHEISCLPENDLPHYMALEVQREVAPPTVEIQAEEALGDGRRLKLLLKPGRDQHRVVVGAKPNFGSDVVVNGRPIATPLRGLALNFSETSEVEIELTTAGKIELGVTGFRYELPASAEWLRKTRPAWAAPAGRGDHIRVTAQFEF